MRKLNLTFIAILGLVLFSHEVQAGPEYARSYGVATKVPIDIRKFSTGEPYAGLADVTCVCKSWSDSAVPADMTTACATGAATEKDGTYWATLTAGETSVDYLEILCVSATPDTVPFRATLNMRSGAYAALNANVPTSPTAGSLFQRLKDLTSSRAAFQAGSTTTVLKLAVAETSNNLAGGIITIDSGNAYPGWCRVGSYNPTTKEATCVTALVTAPLVGDEYSIMADTSSVIPADMTALLAAIYDEQRSLHTILGSFGEGVASVQGNVTGSVGSVTGNVSGNVTGSVGSVTGNVGGSVGYIAAGGISGASYGSDTVDRVGTAQTAGTNTIRLAAAEFFTDDSLNRQWSVYIPSATTGAGQLACICKNVASTDQMTLCRPWKIVPTGTIHYMLIPTPNCDLSQYPVGR